MATLDPRVRSRPSIRISGPGDILRFLLVALAVAMALLSGYGITEGQKKLAVLSLAVFVGLVLTAIALTRFKWLVVVLLVIRSSIDVLHVSHSGAGTTAGNNVGNLGQNVSSLLGVFFLLASFLWLAARAYSGERRRMSTLAKWLTAMYLAGALSILTSEHMQASALQSLRIMTGVVMFLVLEQLITDEKSLRLYLIAVFGALVFPLIYTAYGLATGGGGAQIKSGFTRITGTFSETNDYGRFLGFLIVVGVALLPYLSRKLRIFLTGALIVSAIFLVMTLTLGAMLGTVIGVVIVGVLQKRRALLVSLVLGGVLALTAAPGLAGRLHDSSTSASIGGGPTGNSLAWRFGYWAQILPLANSNPFTGIGLNSTQYATTTAKQPHNDYLRAYVETGLVGVTTYTGAVIGLVGTAWRAVKRTRRKTLHHAIAAGAFACMVAFAIESAADNVITNVVNLWYVLTFAAAAAYLARIYAPAKDEAPAKASVEASAEESADQPAERTPEPVDAEDGSAVRA